MNELTDNFMEANVTNRAFFSIEESDFFWPGSIPGRWEFIPDDDSDYTPRGIEIMAVCEQGAGKPLYLRVRNLIAEFGAGRAAREMGVSEGRVYKFGQLPECEGGSGADIPVKHLYRLLAAASMDTTRPRLQDCVDDIVDYLAAPAGRRLVRVSDLRDLQMIVGVLQGEGGGVVKRLAVTSCPDCGDQLFRVSEIEGQKVFLCRSCGK